ncbi:hypothetical protein ACTFIW_011973 [Dictyostelium discoideum]
MELSNYFFKLNPKTENLQGYYYVPFLKAVAECNINDIKYLNSLGLKFKYLSFKIPFSLNKRLLNEDDELIHQEYNTMFNIILDNQMVSKSWELINYIADNGYYKDDINSDRIKNKKNSNEHNIKFNLSKIKINIKNRTVHGFFSNYNLSRLVIEDLIYKKEDLDDKDFKSLGHDPYDSFKPYYSDLIINQINKCREIIKNNNNNNNNNEIQQPNLKNYLRLLEYVFQKHFKVENFEKYNQMYNVLIENQFGSNIEEKQLKQLKQFLLYKRSPMLKRYLKNYNMDRINKSIKTISLEFIQQSSFDDLIISLIYRPYNEVGINWFKL